MGCVFFHIHVCCYILSSCFISLSQQMADKAGEYMEGHKVKFVRHTVPIKVELVEEGTPRRLKVEFKNVDTGAVGTEEYNTVRTLSVCLSVCLSV